MVLKFNPCMGSDISGEYHRTGGFECSVKLNNRDIFNNYYILIKPSSDFKFGEKGWRVFIYLALQNFCSRANLLADVKIDKLHKAKKFAEDYIYNFETCYAYSYIQDWKRKFVKPTFDGSLNWVGDTYFGYNYITQDGIDYYDYFNDNKIDYHYGMYYSLDIINDKLVCWEYHISPACYGVQTNEENKLELLNKVKEMMQENPVYDFLYERFRGR